MYLQDRVSEIVLLRSNILVCMILDFGKIHPETIFLLKVGFRCLLLRRHIQQDTVLLRSYQQNRNND